ncbi:MAG TPA: primosomal protein N' [bacterium]|nr:primosomal protein N' [bacterium]
MITNILVNSYTEHNFQPFSYAVPPELRASLQRGQLVRVPFGPRQITGLVYTIDTEADNETLKPVTTILTKEPHLLPWQLELMRWMCEYYLASAKSVIAAINPFIFNKTPASRMSTYYRLVPGYRDKLGTRLGTQQAKIIRELEEAHAHSEPERMLTSHTAASLKSLVNKGIVASRTIKQTPSVTYAAKATHPAQTPTPSQQQAITAIQAYLGTSTTFLLHGVTGSGKTEVYLQVIEAALRQGKQALVLVPEIALTPQTIERVAGRFPGQVAVWHSKLNPTERYATYEQVLQGKISIIVGSRSALFLPFAHLGVIAIDEEHEISYKQEKTPRYHARTVAEQLSKLTDAVVILGSATPSLESYTAARQGTMRLLSLPTRINVSESMPEVEIVDLRLEFKKGNRQTISKRLYEEIERNLQQGEQTILFLNRRGRSTYVFCRECGHVLKCNQCEIPYTYHTDIHGYYALLICHHCGNQQQPPQLCSKCGGNKIRYLGAGTQKVVEDVQQAFPTARLLRLDTDSTTRKNAYEQVHAALTERKVDILIGTQMVAKGWDLPGVSLIGVILADQTLGFPDFRSGERTFQLLTQVAGRAGRRDLPGRVIIQTYDPDNEYIRAAEQHDYARLSDFELALRQQFRYPPFTNIIRCTIAHPEEVKALQQAQDLIATLSSRAEPDIDLLGPVPAYIPRLGGRYYFHIILKGQNPHALLQYVPKDWTIDIDPISLV